MNLKWVVAAIMLLILVAPLLFLLGKPPAPPSPPPAVTLPEPPPPDPNAPIVTKAEYDAIKNGMTYEQVVELIGDIETESQSVYDKGVQGYTGPSLMAWHTWKNPDGSFASVGFMSNKVEEKKEEKLK